MASRSPSPNSSPSAVPPAAPTNSAPPLESSTDAPPPPSSSPAPPSNSSVPPPESSPPPVPSTPPPSLSQSPPPVTSPPPPALPSSPPPLPPPLPSSPPPSPPASPPPSPPIAPPPTTNSPPPSPPIAPPPTTNSPPPPIQSPPPPRGSPPKESPAPLVSSPPPPPLPSVSPLPPPPTVSSSPPPPSRDPPPPITSPPPPVVHPPKSSHPPPPFPPPPNVSPSSPPSIGIPPPAYPRSPPPVPSSYIPPSPLRNSSVNGTSPVSPLPSFPLEKPTARSTQSSPNITADTTSGNPNGLKAGGVAVIGSVVGFLALSFVILAVWFTHRRRKRKDEFSLNYAMPSPFASSQNSGSSFLGHQSSAKLAGSASASNFMYSTDGGIGTSRSWFTYEELSEATNGFSKDNILGEGGFGCVYKGVLVDGREVAVKQLKAGSGQGEREFQAEVEIISRIHHRHLVSLVGYCISEHQRLLIYDYVPNDTLHYHLHGEGKPVMDWATRVKVAAGSARGLAYLHEDCQPRIIHRDIKSSNILLDKNFEARVADFGLAKLALDLDLQTHVSTRVMGTFGYLAPEYASTGKLTVKSDVFSFGVVLLELVTGRKPVDASQPLGDESLVEWARPLLAHALETQDFGNLVDPRLENNFVESEMFRMIEAAAACVRHLAAKRPRMSQLVRALDAMDELADLNNGTKPGQSGIFDSREHSAQIRMFQQMAFGSQEYSSEFFNHSQSSWRN